MRSYLLAVLMVATVLLLAACGGGAASPTAPAQGTMGEVTITVDNSLSFKPSAIEGTAGQPVNITMTNVSTALEHNFVWDDQADQVFIHTDPGVTESASRTFDQPGTYTFACTIPGHKEGGMVGTLTIK